MYKSVKFVLLAVLLATCNQTSLAGVISGTISSTGDTTTNLDIWQFKQLNDGVSVFDVLAYELDPLTSSWVDLNNDAQEDYLDSMLWLFRDDGALDLGDLIASSDDSPLGADTNGSFADPVTLNTSLDPFISTYLNAGNYFLVVGSCCGSALDFTTMTQTVTTTPHHPLEGDYRIDYSGDLSLIEVSEPNMVFALIFLAMIFLARELNCQGSPLTKSLR